MAGLSRSLLAKLLYGFLFVVLLPLLFIVWARETETIVSARAVHFTPMGGVLFAIGFTMILSGWVALWQYGRGLPMNIAPPPRFVSSGIYRILPHPIYVGFCVLCAGVAIAWGSASGLWLVTPCVILGCIALVLGYERPDLDKRFGRERSNVIRVLPGDSPETPTLSDRMACYFFVLVPWLVLYEAFVALGIPSGAISTYLPFERRMPVLEWTEIVYASTYAWVLLAPLVGSTQRSLRQFCVRGWVSIAIVYPLFLVFPFVAEPRPFAPHTIVGRLLVWERSLDSPVAAFPSYRVVWAIVALRVYQDRMPKSRLLWRSLTLAISISCLTTGMHSLVDVLAGVLAGLVALRPAKLWEAMRHGAESLANSWQEWRFGPVRIINHGIYAAVAAFVVVYIAGAFTGAASEAYVLLIAMTALISSGLWAQFVEGSPRLLRPFGFFGGLIGVTFGAGIAKALGAQFWLVAAAFSVAAPWMQAIGRLRCLVQGCCHGHPSPADVGICYTHERSRVSQLSGLRGIPIHPTPLYSILWNVYLGLMMAHLWMVHVPLHFLCGVYWILMGLGRFAEEAYRGEPQTPIFGGLRLYQWAALATILCGGFMTVFGMSGAAPNPHFGRTILLPALAFGLIAGFALGVDFPNSNQRFARLA